MSIKKQFLIFLLRWLLTSGGIWLAITLLGGVVAGHQPGIWTYLAAGLTFSLVNSLLKPIITILSLPAILLTLGLFIVVVNGFLVYLALLVIPSLKLSFFKAMLAGLLLSLINYIISGLLEFYN
ncbi:MAG: phage holin family protein, partial [Segetibacter sp.]